jgi:hypothetical protein
MNRFKYIIRSSLTTLIVGGLNAFAAELYKPDALLAIDLNRAAVVEKITLAWGGEISTGQRESFKNKLMALRADQLLSATLSGSFEGVLEVLNSKEVAKVHGFATSFSLAQTHRLSGPPDDKSKTLGDTNADLVYTPLVPCRLLDTRTGQSSALGNVGGTFTNQQTKTITPGSACGLPTTGVASLMLSFHAYNNVPATLGVIGFMAPGTPFSALAATWTGANWATGTYITRTSPNGSFDAFIGNTQPMTADLIVDVMGYFRAPQGMVGDITEIQTTAGSGLIGGVANGIANLALDPAFKLPQNCTTGQTTKFNTSNSAWECAATASGGVTSVATGAGLQGGPIASSGTISLVASQLLPTTTCIAGQSVQWSGSAWICSPPTPASLPSCVFGETVAAGLGGQLQCGVPNTFVHAPNFPNGVIVRGNGGLPVVFPGYLDGQNGVLRCTNPRCMAGSISTTVPMASGQTMSVSAATLTNDGFPIAVGITFPLASVKFLKCTSVDCTGVSVISTNADLAFPMAMTTAGDGFPLVLVSQNNVSTPTLWDLKLWKCSNSSCSSLTVISLGTLPANARPAHASIAVGADGLPIFTYMSVVPSPDPWPLITVKCTSISCASPVSTVVGTFTSNTSAVSIVVPNDGLPVIGINEFYGSLQTIKCATPSCSTRFSPSIIAPSAYATRMIGVIVFDGMPLFLAGESNKAFSLIKCGNIACNAANVINRPLSGIGYDDLQMVLSADGLPLISGLSIRNFGLMKCVDLLCTVP